MGERTDVAQTQSSLNPEAPEFFPARNALVSDPCPVFSPQNPPLLHYQTLPSPYPHAFSAPLFSHPFCPYPHQHAVPLHFFTPEKAAAAASVTEPFSSLLEPLNTEMVLEEEEAQKHKVMGRKENVGGARRSNRSKHFLRNKRYGKEGFVGADQSQSRKKYWRAKPSSDAGDQQFGRNFEASFEYPRKVQVWAGNNKREKHPPIPLKYDGKETTIMIRNIPNRYTREMLKDFLDQHCMLTNRDQVQSQNGDADEEPLLSAFDFLYLPIDFVTKSNKGYAFVNFTNPQAARKFFDAWHHKRWQCFQSHKICEIYCAKLQGMEQLVKHFERMEFPSEDFQPVSFDPSRDGSKQLAEETRVGRCRGSRCTEPNLSHQLMT
ncbi:hypothetical protein QUC31_015449 [Theobroma cacao]|uniref:Terminal EAR1-like 1, putative n=1 Tax=Theobroma cacao TaxID=3641 RepID=A0A061E6I5_THECC|nr:Terminal EAR1-like 1, putative [Theobroma cacao]